MTGRDSFDGFDEAMYPELRIDFDKQMNVIGHDFHRHDFRPVFLGDLSKHLSAPFLYRPFEHFAPILGAEDDVVLARINDMVVRLVSFDHGVIRPHSAIYAHRFIRAIYLSNGRLDPIPKGRGLRRPLFNEENQKTAAQSS
jgi:hypothetical protein